MHISDRRLRGFAVETRYKNDVNGNGFVSARSMTLPRWTREEFAQHLSHCSPEAAWEAAQGHLLRLGHSGNVELSSWAAMPTENGFLFIFKIW